MMKLIKYGFLLLLILVSAFLAWEIFGATLSAPKEKYFTVKTGSSFSDIRTTLIDQKIINSPFLFDQLSKLLHYSNPVKAGRYEVSSSMSLFTLLRNLRSGKQLPVTLVITKLRTKGDLAAKIAAGFECDSASMISLLNNPDSLREYALDSNTVMTAVIPNNYNIFWNSSPAKILKKLVAEKDKFWNDTRKQQAAKMKLTTAEVYTLASIVEEETSKEEDKGKIASVYLNRIHSGQRLEADPTIKFALKDFGLKRIRESHIRAASASPFSTYSNKGLPIGPICTPSSKTIDAVLNAPSTDYFFFVARPDWSRLSVFAHSYADHQVNARKYQRFLDSVNIR